MKLSNAEIMLAEKARNSAPSSLPCGANMCLSDCLLCCVFTFQDSIIEQLKAYCSSLQDQIEDLKDDLRTTQQKCDAEVFVVREEREADNLEKEVQVRAMQIEVERMANEVALYKQYEARLASYA